MFPPRRVRLPASGVEELEEKLPASSYNPHSPDTLLTNLVCLDMVFVRKYHYEAKLW
jgi:hypothetical protein